MSEHYDQREALHEARQRERTSVLEDPRPFSDPAHPIHSAPKPVVRHPDDFAQPRPWADEPSDWVDLTREEALQHGDEVFSREKNCWCFATSREAVMRAKDPTLRFRRHISRVKQLPSENDLGIILTDNGTIKVDGVEMSVAFVRMFLRNADGKHLFAFKREENRIVLTQIADANSANEYFSREVIS